MAGHPEAPNLVLARLLDYWGRRTDWQRRLWNPSSTTVLQETLEAAVELSLGHLREGTVRDLAGCAERQAGPDVGVGSPDLRSAIVETLREVSKSAPAQRRLEYLIESVTDRYLANWRDAFAANPGALPTERVSRIIGSHLLDLGHSPEALHRWATWLRTTSPPASVADLLDAASSVAERPARDWDVFVPFVALAKHRQSMPPEWLEPPQARAWLQKEAPDHPIRHNGGFLIRATARDPWGAVEIASDHVESLAARVSVGLPGSPAFEPAHQAVVAGSRHLVPLGRPRRQVDVHSLHRQNTLYSISEPGLAGRLRSAIDLVAPLETGAPGAAVAGGWAAIEAVLARPDANNVVAATDMAALIACSLPRAELTPLAYAHIAEHNDTLAAALSSAGTNLEKCRLLADAISAGTPLSYSNASDAAALERLREILADPRATLGRIKDYVDTALRRLYRQRNLVLHAGRTDSVAMISTLRTTPPLVGAGLDRLVHAALTTPDFDILRLVARAHAEIRLVGRPDGPHVADLLGT
jgi:hypothetical protein